MYGLKKKDLRNEMKNRRNSLSANETRKAGECICKRLQDIILKDVNTLVLLFASYNNEPDTYIIYETLKENYPLCDTAYPAVSKNNFKNGNPDMEFYRVNDISKLICGYKGIKEPDVKRCDIITINEMFSRYDKIIILIPGLAFDVYGNRTGYGGGFYDRYLTRLFMYGGRNNHADVLKTGICHDFQYIDNGYIIAEAHDIKCDCIITDKRIIYIKHYNKEA